MKKIFFIIASGALLFACEQGPNQATNNAATVQEASMLPAASAATAATTTAQDEVWLESLITQTPQEGRELAIKMARKTIGAIQSDGEVKKRLRGQYAEDAELLILSAQVVAIEFQTVAEANNYWRK